MFHEDGIEVYLKPAGDENDNIRLAEFQLPESQTIEDDKKTPGCAILARHEGLKVVVRPSRDFKMHSASALIIQITREPVAKAWTKTSWNRHPVQRSKSHEQFEQSTFCEFDRHTGAKKPCKREREYVAIAMPKANEGEYSCT